MSYMCLTAVLHASYMCLRFSKTPHLTTVMRRLLRSPELLIMHGVSVTLASFQYRHCNCSRVRRVGL